MGRLETPIQNGIIRYLAVKGYAFIDKKTLPAVASMIIADVRQYRGVFWRNNSGARQGEHRGKKHFAQFGVPGQPDLAGFRKLTLRDPIQQVRRGDEEGDLYIETSDSITVPFGIEVKAARGTLSPNQKLWRTIYEGIGVQYIVASSIEDLQNAGF